MRLGIAGSDTKATAAAAAVPDGARPAPCAADADGAGPVTAAAGPARHDGLENGSKDESFFEATPWLDSDSEDDFYSVRGDFTPSRSSTPVHPRLITSFSGRTPAADRSKPSLVQKKQRLLELLQEKQHYDDDDDSVTNDSSDLENSAVHAEEHIETSRKGKKSNKTSRSGCFPSLIWKQKKTKDHKDKVN